MAPGFHQGEKCVLPAGIALRGGIAAALALLAAAYWFAWRAPAVGTFHDDGIYAVTAKSLAEGRGYRIISLPGEPPQTKYPILFPAALALVWKLAPQFPQNVPLLRLVPMLASVVWLWLSYRLFREEGESAMASGGLIAFAAASPWVVYFSTALLSESLFAVFLTATLLCLRRIERGAAGWLLPVLAGTFAAAAFHTRTAGIAMVAAAPAVLWLRARRREALLSGAVAALLCLPWIVWIAAQSGAGSSGAYYSNANYQGWNILLNFTFAQKVHIGLLNMMLAPTSPAVLAGLPFQGPALVVSLVIGIAFLAAAFRQGLNALTIFIAFYTAMVVCWAWPPSRFYAPVLPLLYLFAWRAVPKRFRLPAVSAAAVLCAALLVGSTLRTIEIGDALPSANSQDRWQDIMAAMHWLHDNTPSDAIVAGNLDPLFYLYSGRQSVRGFDADPYRLIYSRSDTPLGTPAKVASALENTGVSYWIVTPCSSFAEAGPAEALTRAAAEQGSAELLAAGLAPSCRIYRLKQRLKQQTLRRAGRGSAGQ